MARPKKAELEACFVKEVSAIGVKSYMVYAEGQHLYCRLTLENGVERYFTDLSDSACAALGIARAS